VTLQFIKVRDIPSPGPSPRGFAVSGDSIWVADDSDDKVYQIDMSDGTVRSSFDTPSATPGALTIVGDFIYLIDFGVDTLFKIDFNGNVVFSTVIGITDSPFGLTYIGGGFFAIVEGGAEPNSIFITDIEGNIIRSQSGLPIRRGLAWDGTFIWAASIADRDFIAIDPMTLTVVKQYNYNLAANLQGIAWDGLFMWGSVTGTMTLDQFRLVDL